jgi:hypothetical protein
MYINGNKIIEECNNDEDIEANDQQYNNEGCNKNIEVDYDIPLASILREMEVKCDIPLYSFSGNNNVFNITVNISEHAKPSSIKTAKKSDVNNNVNKETNKVTNKVNTKGKLSAEEIKRTTIESKAEFGDKKNNKCKKTDKLPKPNHKRQGTVTEQKYNARIWAWETMGMQFADVNDNTINNYISYQ